MGLYAVFVGRVDTWEITQFLSTNVSERSGFNSPTHKSTISAIVTAYNEIVDRCEANPSLKINLDRNLPTPDSYGISCQIV